MSFQNVGLLSTKAALLVCIWACFLWSAFQWYTYLGSHWWSELYEKIEDKVKTKNFHDLEVSMVYFGGPPLLIAFFSILYFSLPRRLHFSHLKVSRIFYSILNSTLVFPKPLGIIQLGELAGVTALSLLVILHLVFWTREGFKHHKEEYHAGELTKKQLWQENFEYVSVIMGWGSFIVFCFLFYPVSRRSPILRILGIPFELALRYHIWMGHAANFLSTVHGIMYWVLWTMQGHLLEEAFKWQKLGIGNLSGGILLIVSVGIWITSLQVVRRKYFELFFYTHQLYLLYLLFYAFHCGSWVLVYAMGGLFLFFLDRVLRHFQSRYPVDIASSSVLPNGYVELTLPLAEGLEVDSLGVFFLNVPSISSIQWHAFSVSSRSTQTPGYVSLLIKSTKDPNSWTSKLRELAANASLSTVFVEGPYNSELTYFNRYDSLILVAGGAGVAPFLAVVQEVTHLHRAGCRAPASIELIWVVRNATELSLLSSMPCDDLNGKFNLHITIFVTSGSDEDLIREDTKVSGGATKAENAILCPIVLPVGSKNGVVELFVSLTTFLGTILVMALFARHVIYQIDRGTYLHMPLWVGGFIFLAALLLGIVVFASIAAIIDKNFISKHKKLRMSQVTAALHEARGKNEGKLSLLQSSKIQYGGRPNWDDVFTEACDKLPRGTNVGVMVCGPHGMSRSVAWECQKRSIFTQHPQTLNFHALSFDF